jgi:hypothetical protein
LNEEGHYRPEYVELFRTLVASSEDHYLALIHRQSPRILDLAIRGAFLQQQLRPLRHHETKLLLQQVLRKSGVAASPGDIDALVEYLGGYPPAIYLAESLAEQYGMAALVADTSILVDFKARRFAGFVSRIRLPETARTALHYLAQCGSSQAVR